jgi:hypothetical protein
MDNIESNPFADPHDLTNPFSDQSVSQASRSGAQRVETVDEFNPFAEDQFVKKVGTTPPQPPPVVYEAPPPAYSAPSAPPQAGGHGAEYLQARQEELDRKAEELDRRERAMLQGVDVATRINNFPPLPQRFPVKPCFYQDISVDIPAQFQKIIKANFYVWMAYACVLFVNVWMSLAYFIVSSSNDMNNQSGTTFGLSILYFCLWTPCSFVCWFRAVYNAFRCDSSFFFFAYFFIFVFQIIANVIQAISIQGSGSVGFVSGLGMFGKSTGPTVIGILMLCMGAAFTCLAIAGGVLLIRVHAIYRSTGASFQKAQAEFAQGIVTNKAVQQTAAGVASSAARQAMEQPFATNPSNRF